jgi:hypothetical protein
MKNKKLILLISSILITNSASSETKYIQAYSVKLKANPGLMGKSLGELKNKDPVEPIQESGAYIKVRAGKIEGWIPRSSVTTAHRLKLKSGNQVATSNSGVLAAGKGLGENVGESNSAKPDAKQKVGLDRLDKIEKETPDDQDIDQFAKEGGFQPAVKIKEQAK